MVAFVAIPYLYFFYSGWVLVVSLVPMLEQKFAKFTLTSVLDV